jgi:hypothetical protein
MTNEDLELELELKQLKPRRVSAQLVESIGRELERSRGTPVERLAFQRLAGWACAALLMVGMFWASLQTRPGFPASMASAKPELKPAGATTVILQADDEGLVTFADGSAARRYRIRALDTYTWTNPSTNASLRWTVPREDVRVIPVSIY